MITLAHLEYDPASGESVLVTTEDFHRQPAVVRLDALEDLTAQMDPLAKAAITEEYGDHETLASALTRTQNLEVLGLLKMLQGATILAAEQLADGGIEVRTDRKTVLFFQAANGRVGITEDTPSPEEKMQMRIAHGETFHEMPTMQDMELVRNLNPDLEFSPASRRGPGH